MKCLRCGKHFSRKPSEGIERYKNRKYCSRDCSYNRKPLTHNGNDYKSLRDMADKLNTSTALISYYLRKDIPFRDAFIDYKI
jgi:hypothetical protein